MKPDTSLNPLFIMTETEEAAAINNTLLRKSFRALTESFLEVFEIYFRLQINVNFWKRIMSNFYDRI